MSTFRGAPSSNQLRSRLQAVAGLDARGEPLKKQEARVFLGVQLGIERIRLTRAGQSENKVLTLLNSRTMSDSETSTVVIGEESGVKVDVEVASVTSDS